MSQNPTLMLDLGEKTRHTLNWSWGRTFAHKGSDLVFLSKLAASDSNSMTYEQYSAIHDVLNDPNDPRSELMIYLAIIMIWCKDEHDKWVHVNDSDYHTIDDNKWMHCTSIFQWVALYIHSTMGFRL